MTQKGRRAWLKALASGVILSPFVATNAALKSVSSLKINITQSSKEAENLIANGFDGFIWIRETCSFELQRLQKIAGSRVSGMLIDAYTNEQAALIKKISPAPQKILIPVDGSLSSQSKIKTIEKAFESIGIESISVNTDSPPYYLSSINSRLSEVQAIEMTPIESLFDQAMMKIWVAMSIRQKTPLIGAWRASQIRQGALIGMVYDASEVNRIQNEAVKKLMENGHWEDKAYKPKVTLTINQVLLPYYSIMIKNE